MANYGNVGNVGKDYKHEPRTVRPEGLITTPDLVLKLYSMAKSDHPSLRDIDNTRDFLEAEIREQRMSPFLGLGFAILSEDMLNVSRWDTEYPIVVKNQIYGFEESIRSAELLKLEDSGSFCIWELGIVNHEKESWKRFLESQKDSVEKLRYLDDFFEGNL